MVMILSGEYNRALLALAVIFLTAVGLFLSQPLLAGGGDRNTMPWPTRLCADDLREAPLRIERVDRGALRVKYTEDHSSVANQILPHLDPDRRVIVGFKGPHAYIFYKNHLIMAGGIPGVWITSTNEEHVGLMGPVVAVIHDLSDEELAAYDREIESGKARGAMTCARMVCQFGDGAIGDRVGNAFFRPSTLLRKLIEYKREGGGVEFVTRGSWSLDKSLEKIKEAEESVFTVAALRWGVRSSPASASLLLLTWFFGG